jgi:peptide-methionine (S)-S-oxide reductase
MMPVDDERSEGSASTEVATLGGGGFWCLGSSRRRAAGRARGRIRLLGWYRAGSYLRASLYVCAGTTDHAEVVRVTFDPTIVSFREVLEVYFSIHDPPL